MSLTKFFEAMKMRETWCDWLGTTDTTGISSQSRGSVMHETANEKGLFYGFPQWNGLGVVIVSGGNVPE
jgi:hypothetical protein